MAENNKMSKIFLLLPELLAMLVMAGGIGLSYLWKNTAIKFEYILCDMVFAILGMGSIGALVRMANFDKKEVKRFYICFFLGIAIAFICIFLPHAVWPYVPVFIMLLLFGNSELALIGGSVLLFIPLCITQTGLEIFFMYLFAGLLSLVVFKGCKESRHTAISLVLSESALFVCEFAGEILIRNARPDLELFVLPIANMLVTVVMLLGILKVYYDLVVYRYRNQYLDLNNPECEILLELKEKDKQNYMRNIHVAYFCDRFAAQFSLDKEAIKSASYYHRISDGVIAKKVAELIGEGKFPPKAVAILKEFKERKKMCAETVVLIASDKVISELMQRLEKEVKIDYDLVIEQVFDEFLKNGTWSQSELTMAQLSEMQTIFKEEKLYYDFLR